LASADLLSSEIRSHPFAPAQALPLSCPLLLAAPAESKGEEVLSSGIHYARSLTAPRPNPARNSRRETL
jgi:hypothetical protein